MKKKRQHYLFINLLLLIAFVTIGCHKAQGPLLLLMRDTAANPESFDRFYADPRVDTEANDQFDFLYETCEIHEEDGMVRLRISVTAYPKYARAYRNFVVNFAWNDTVANGVTAGRNSYGRINEPVHIRAKEDFIGRGFGMGLGLWGDEELAALGLSRESVLEAAKTLTILLEYDGKKVSFPLTYREPVQGE